jgi:bidirectional [NiFe] hydrogenase diaphorase subunit
MTLPRRSRVKTLQIDGQDVGAHEDETVLQVARDNGFHIPTLCQLEGLSIPGACRLCLVEIEGWNSLVPACATYVEEGMKISTNSERLQKYRKMIVEMLFATGNHVCSMCVSNGNCELQDLSVEFGVDKVRFSVIPTSNRVDMSHDLFVLDMNRCVLCTRCVRVCAEIEGAHNWDVMGRGIKCEIISDFNTPWGDSVTCSSCGKCVNACPTGAIVEKGKGAGEMVKNTHFLEYITKMRKVNT